MSNVRWTPEMTLRYFMKCRIVYLIEITLFPSKIGSSEKSRLSCCMTAWIPCKQRHRNCKESLFCVDDKLPVVSPMIDGIIRQAALEISYASTSSYRKLFESRLVLDVSLHAPASLPRCSNRPALDQDCWLVTSLLMNTAGMYQDTEARLCRKRSVRYRGHILIFCCAKVS